jgi:hypothetical protein
MKINEIIKENFAQPQAVASKEVGLIVNIINALIGEGHDDGVRTNVIINKVINATKKPFNYDDLLALNNSSHELQHLIDTLHPDEVTFRQDKVKNEDPYKEKQEQQQQAQSTIEGMANRAAGKKRVGESVELAEAIHDHDTSYYKDNAKEAKANGDKIGYWTWMYHYHYHQKNLYGEAKRNAGGQMSNRGSKYMEQAAKHFDKAIECQEKVEKLGGTIDKSSRSTAYQDNAQRYASDFAKNVTTGQV